MTTPLVRVEHLSAGFEDHVVFRRIDFEVPARGALGILGPSGAGKSTLLRALGRWNDLRPSFWVHGRVLCGERDLLTEVEREEVHRRFALLQQKARLFTSTVLENAISGLADERPTSRAEKRDLAHFVLAPFDRWESLGARLDAPVTSLPLAEQRMLTLARLTAAGAEAILADEPTRDVEDELLPDLVRMLAALKERLSLVLVTHSQSLAHELLDGVVLITAGTLVERGDASRFFAEPMTELGRRYRRSGNCWPSRDEMDPEWLAHQDRVEASREISLPAPASDSAASRPPSWVPTPFESAPRPGGFHWIEAGLLGGMQWPGLLRDDVSDLDGLVRLGVRHLVSLTERPYPIERLGTRPIEIAHFPIADMRAPDLDACLALCRRVLGWLDSGEATVFHCRAGLGRTGTMLACMRVLRGRTAVAALDDVRRVNPLYVQSSEQADFVARLSDYVRRMA